MFYRRLCDWFVEKLLGNRQPARPTVRDHLLMLNVRWRTDGRGGAVYEDEEFVGLIALEDWHEDGAREPRRAWVVQFVVPGEDTMQRALIELDGEPATDTARAADLATKAKAVVDQGIPPTPSPFGHALTGLGTNAETRELIQLTGYALDAAAARVMSAAQDPRPEAVMALNVAVTEMMGWLRTTDELSELIWNEKLTAAEREAVSQAADKLISSPQAAPGLVSVEYAARQASGQPYKDWTIALLGASTAGWVPREQLRGFRWLAGKMLHHGPLSAVELVQWRAGEAPRWKWRTADDIFPPSRNEQRPSQRREYDTEIAGKDVIGFLRFNELAFSLDRLFADRLR
jgi:hypothetical protein